MAAPTTATKPRVHRAHASDETEAPIHVVDDTNRGPWLTVERSSARRPDSVCPVSKSKKHQNRGVEKRGNALEEQRSRQKVKSRSIG